MRRADDWIGKSNKGGTKVGGEKRYTTEAIKKTAKNAAYVYLGQESNRMTCKTEARRGKGGPQGGVQQAKAQKRKAGSVRDSKTKNAKREELREQARRRKAEGDRSSGWKRGRDGTNAIAYYRGTRKGKEALLTKSERIMPRNRKVNPGESSKSGGGGLPRQTLGFTGAK